MLVYVTVFMSPHIISECNKFYELMKGDFLVIETKEITIERQLLGYKSKVSLPYVKRYIDDVSGFNKIILDADTVIFAEIPNSIINKRILNNKLTFISSERLFKRGLIKIFHYKLWKQIWSNILAYKKNTHLLCDGSFVGQDFAAIGFSKEKMWKHGYFPTFRRHDMKDLFFKKKSTNINILWVGRIIPWKKPIDLLKSISNLIKEDPSLNIKVDIVGTGQKKIERKIIKYITKNNLKEKVFFHGLLENDSVFMMMESANIFVSTSDKNEGWGAVVNEAMNSGCAVLVSNLIGCASYLIKENENGLTYKSGCIRDLSNKLKYLVNNPQIIELLGHNAYYTIKNKWNSDIAAERLVELINDIKENITPSYSDGPCSKVFNDKHCKGVHVNE